jgi:transcriptional regulator with XRE-family HTH domain
MDDRRTGTVFRMARQARRWRQTDLEARSGVSQSAISRIECRHIGPQSIQSLRDVAAALDIQLDIVSRWRAGDLDRLLSGAHSALHESIARWFRAELPEWVLSPEVSFSIYGERGVIDILAWHPGRRALLVVELKTDIVDVNELLGTFDRKRRLAIQVARSRGCDPVTVSAWLIISDSRTNRRRVDAHGVMLHGALPDDRRDIERWLRVPAGSVAGLSFWPNTRAAGPGRLQRPIRRVRRSVASVAERQC